MRDTLEVQWDEPGKPPDTVHVDGRDWLHWEAETGESAVDVLRRGGFTEWYAAAWAALHRAGRFHGSPGEFAEQASIVFPVKPPPDPTTPPEDGTRSA